MNTRYLWASLALIGCADPEIENPIETADTGMVEADAFENIPSGLYVLTFHEGDDGRYTPECQENFIDYKCVQNVSEPVESPWTYENTWDNNDEWFFVEIGTDGARPFLLMEDTIIFGEESEGGVTFELERFENSMDADRHEGGYVYELAQEWRETQTMTLTFDEFGFGMGEMVQSSMNFTTIRETDMWDTEVVDRYGSYINSWYLDYYLIDHDDYGYYPYNNYSAEECEGADCMLKFGGSGTYKMNVELTYYGPSNGNLESYDHYDNEGDL